MRRYGLTLLVLFIWLPGCSVEGGAPPLPSLTPGPEDVVEFDQWLNGTLDDQPVANTHVVTVRHPDGTRTTLSDTAILFQRTLLGNAVRFSINETNLFREDAEGYLTSFQIHQEENGARSTAVGRVFEDRIDVVVHLPRNRLEQTLELPDGVRLMGVEAAQRGLTDADLEPGEAMSFHSVALLFGQVRVVEMQATYVEPLSEELHRYRIVITQMPGMAIDVDLDDGGMVQRMVMGMGAMKFAFTPGDEPVALAGAELSMEGLITHQGPAPRAGAQNRYRLEDPLREHLPQDDFQRLDEHGILVVTTEAAPEVLADPAPYLIAEPQIEIEDPELRAWVIEALADAPAGAAAQARHLTTAVRGHLAGDLSRGDASALEAFHSRKGDCTEHANLLCAALRIAGIPSRVEVGVVYAAQLGGWGGHAWNSAYDAEAGLWIHLDAAYPGVPRSCYIRTGSPNAAEQETGAMLDGGMSLVMGQTIEVLAPNDP